MIYHLLPELEPFSAVSGGALARDVANIMRWSPSAIVVCRRADDTWGYSADRILTVPGLCGYNRMRGRRFLPVSVARTLLRVIFRPLIARLREGDIVWNHNQLVFSAALEKSIRARGAKLIHHFHDGHLPYGSSRAALRSFTPDATIFVSEFLKQHWLKHFPGLRNTHAIPNGADETLFFPLPPDGDRTKAVPVVLYVGRLHPEKGVHVLIDAMRLLHERKIRALCKIVGSAFAGGSKATPYVKALLNSSPSNVRFEGHRSGQHVAKEYRDAHILCCPSVWQEPFGNVTIEAMASGIPVVATRVGGIVEIAAEGGVLLVDANSSVSLADGLQRVIEDIELRKQLAGAGLRSFRRRYTWAAVCSRYQQIVASVSA